MIVIGAFCFFASGALTMAALESYMEQIDGWRPFAVAALGLAFVGAGVLL